MLEENLSKASLFGLLEKKYELKLENSRQALEPALASQEEAKLLGIKKAGWYWLWKGRLFLDNGKPIDMCGGYIVLTDIVSLSNFTNEG
ncbi:UTRA domain-containing protein [candidate division NPL-UPA2 bacterium]|nr:UTRA domain-containing protein [candidate division NPL-UPA2 bacterium]